VPKLSVTVITKNEAANIAAALDSVRWADEIVVVDAESTDETVPIARGYTGRVTVRRWESYAEQKNHAASLAQNDWILSLDADERVTASLRREIQSLLSGEPAARGYRIPRLTHYLGQWITTTDWYPDLQLRLYDRRAGRWPSRRVHESVQVDGAIGLLTHALEHYPYRDLAQHLDTINRYTTLAALDMQEGQRHVGFSALALHPLLAFLRNYILKGGVRQGLPGLVISCMNAYYVFLKFAKLWEAQRKTPDNPAETERGRG
jgi:glycosyltransferase involved in cell wall biosynthesis